MFCNMCVKIKRLSVKCLCVSILTETLIHNLKNGCMKRYLTVIECLECCVEIVEWLYKFRSDIRPQSAARLYHSEVI